MKNLQSLLVLIFFLVTASCTNATSFKFYGEPYLSQNYLLTGPGDLKVETSGSSVSVSGTTGNTVTIDMYVKYKGKEIDTESAEVEALLEDYDLDFSQNGNTITLKAKKSGSWGWNSDNRLSLAFKISVPHNMSTNINSSGGSISLTEITGEQEINTSGGSINVSKSDGKLLTRSSGGSFRLEEFRGNVSVQTSGGSVKISQVEGDISIGSSGGSVSLEEIDGSINASTSGGSIKAQLSNLEKSLTLKSSGGSITAVVPAGLGLDLDLRGGRVNTSLSNFSGEQKKDKVSGTINGGGIPVTLQSSGGSISLEFEGKN
jgi:hypothetical protein